MRVEIAAGRVFRSMIAMLENIVGRSIPIFAAANHSQAAVVPPLLLNPKEAFGAVFPNSWPGKRVVNPVAIALSAVEMGNIALLFTRTCAIATTTTAECCFVEGARAIRNGFRASAAIET